MTIGMHSLTSRKIQSKAYDKLSHRYRHTLDKKGLRSEDEARAYVTARMPATQATIKRCLNELPLPYTPKTSLDVGAGPGTASLALLERFPDIQTTLIEDDPYMWKIGQDFVPHGQWIRQKLNSSSVLPSADLVILSYVLNELPQNEMTSILDSLWKATKDYLLIITPGTPDAFSQIRIARHYLITQGARLLAPCPHSFDCPIQGNDWCHFTVRLNRSAEHRRIKSAELGYEDEKFSYLILSRHPELQQESRVTKPPQHRSGHGSFEVCTPQGQLKTIPYSKAKSQNYKILKDLNWGDTVSASRMCPKDTK